MKLRKKKKHQSRNSIWNINISQKFVTDLTKNNTIENMSMEYSMFLCNELECVDVSLAMVTWPCEWNIQQQKTNQSIKTINNLTIRLFLIALCSSFLLQAIACNESWLIQNGYYIILYYHYFSVRKNLAKEYAFVL